MTVDAWIVRREAIMVITNLIYVTEPNNVDEQTTYQICTSEDYKLLQILVKCLGVSEKDQEVCEELLHTFHRILTLDKIYSIPEEKTFSYKFEELDGLNILEELQMHKIEKIHEFVLWLIEQHFD